MILTNESLEEFKGLSREEKEEKLFTILNACEDLGLETLFHRVTGLDYNFDIRDLADDEIETALQLIKENRTLQSKLELEDEEVEESLKLESKNPLKDAQKAHRKKNKGLSPFSYLNPGDVEKGIETFNKNMTPNTSNQTNGEITSTGEGMGEGLDTSNIYKIDYKFVLDNNITDDEAINDIKSNLRDYNLNLDSFKIDTKFTADKNIDTTISGNKSNIEKWLEDRIYQDYNLDKSSRIYKNYINNITEAFKGNINDVTDYLKLIARKSPNAIQDKTIEDYEFLINDAIEMGVTAEQIKQAIENSTSIDDLSKRIYELSDKEKYKQKYGENLQEDMERKTYEEIKNSIDVLGPEFRGDDYPQFNEAFINESKIPDNMRFKMFDTDILEHNTIQLTWTTEEAFSERDVEEAIPEFNRFFTYLATKFKTSLDIKLIFKCRYGTDRGYSEISIKTSPKGLEEELRVWGDEEISAQNDLVKWEQALEDFLENNNIEYDRVKCDVFDYGTNIVIVNPEDIEEVAQEIEDHYGFKTTIEDNNIYVDVTEEYEDEYGDIKTRVSKRYHESFDLESSIIKENLQGYTLDSKLYDYFKATNPSDPFGDDIDKEATFRDLFNAINDNTDVYEVIFGDENPGDSVVREELFNGLAEILNTNYDNVYYAWLGHHPLFESNNIIDIRKELNRLDSEEYRDLLNMYDSIELAEHEKKHIAELISQNKIDELVDYLQELYYVYINVYDGNGNGIVTNDLGTFYKKDDLLNDGKFYKHEGLNDKTLKESVDWDYFDKFEPIINKYMPDRGEGETMASQIVTAVNKLIYKWYNDGDVYDNTRGLPGWANDLSDYANWLYKYVPKTQYTLDLIEEVSTDGGYEEILQLLADLTLNEEFLSKYTDEKCLGSIYNCNGPFKFIDLYDDDEDDDSTEDW